MQENKLANYSVVFMALVLLAIVLKTFQAVLRPLAIAVLLFFIVVPLSRYSRKKGIPVWLTFTGLFVLFVGFLSLASSFITVENVNLKHAIPLFQEKISQNTGGILGLGSKLGFGLEEVTPDTLSKLAGKCVKVGVTAARVIFSETLLASILLMFLLHSNARLLRSVERQFGKTEVERLQVAFKKIEGDIIAYLGTKIAMSFGTAMGTGVVLGFFKAKFVYISMLLTFILNFIPVIGSIAAVFIVLILYLLTFGPSATVAWLFILLMAVQIIFGSVLEPKIAGSRLNMSPIVIILCLYLWGWIWGIVGMLLSVPLTLVIVVIVKYIKLLKVCGGGIDHEMK